VSSVPSGRRAITSVNVPPRSIQNCQPDCREAIELKCVFSVPLQCNRAERLEGGQLDTIRTDPSVQPAEASARRTRERWQLAAQSLSDGAQVLLCRGKHLPVQGSAQLVGGGTHPVFRQNGAGEQRVAQMNLAVFVNEQRADHERGLRRRN